MSSDFWYFVCVRRHRVARLPRTLPAPRHPVRPHNPLVHVARSSVLLWCGASNRYDNEAAMYDRARLEEYFVEYGQRQFNDSRVLKFREEIASIPTAHKAGLDFLCVACDALWACDARHAR